LKREDPHAAYRIGVNLCAIIILVIVGYISGGWDPHVPISWFIMSAVIGLCEVTAIPILLLMAGFQGIGRSFLWFPWALILFTPIFVYGFIGDKLIEPKKDLTDVEFLTIAKKYGGILTPSVVVWETNVKLEKAKKRSERFVKHGDANKKKIGPLTIYDFPSTRIYLARSDNQIIELLRDNPQGISRAMLLILTKMQLDVLDESLKRLESSRIIYQDPVTNNYGLKGIVTTPKGKRVERKLFSY